jgi:hypothetical protein
MCLCFFLLLAICVICEKKSLKTVREKL